MDVVHGQRPSAREGVLAQQQEDGDARGVLCVKEVLKLVEVLGDVDAGRGDGRLEFCQRRVDLARGETGVDAVDLCVIEGDVAEESADDEGSREGRGVGRG